MAKDHQVPSGRALVVGLGNPGSKYTGTRHNIGFLCVEAFAARWGISLNEKKFKGLLGTGRAGDRMVSVLEPQTFMNLSGESVGPAAGFYRLTPDSVIVAHDDIDLEPGRVRIKIGGGHGGHNGLRSCDKHLPSKDYIRIRLGVGRPPVGEVSGWVLGRFAASDQTLVEQLIEVGADAIEGVLNDGLLATQNRIHPL